ncbi:hypothetical protein [uncultured Microscilla sp.]|uniref:hypothetical protein n=1 Tax=uncultured Microscilla sp. TaxID=432653 RepID=UPI002601F7A8|nr:hypothetical protein [uncultured Microscilla sp.]
MDTESVKKELVELLTKPPVPNASITTLYGVGKDRVGTLCNELLQKKTLSLMLPTAVLQSYLPRDKAVKQTLSLGHTVKKAIDYKRFGGLNIYAYIEIQAIPDASPGISIIESLPPILEYADDVNKHESWQVLDSLPFIFKSIVNYARLYQIQGVRFVVTNARYHPIDYRNYAYYICVVKCLNEVFGINP